MHNDLEKFVENNRSEFDSLNPNPDILNRIQAQMKPSKAVIGHESLVTSKKSMVYRLSSIGFRWAAAAVVIALAGVGTYSLLNTKKDTSYGMRVTSKSVKDTGYGIRDTGYESRGKEKALLAQVNNQPEARISKPVSSLSSIVYARLTNMESASERYAAASELIDKKKIDIDIIKVLVKTMNNDPNSNVRLAALEALSKYHREPYVKKQLIQSMSVQKDPVVQIALIEFLSTLRNTNIKNALQKIAEDANTDKPVKDQAYSSLTKISL